MLLNKILFESNLFNFAILVGILWFCAVRFNLMNILVSAQNKVIQSIEEVKLRKSDSEKALNDAQSAISTLGKEINDINSNAEDNANILYNKIIEDANVQADHISKNADKTILAEEKQIVANLIKDFSKVSIEKSKENVINMLNNNQEMHERYINESIDKLDGLKL
jgi:F0F1-type ATP synthase membrane subunit b/b'